MTFTISPSPMMLWRSTYGQVSLLISKGVGVGVLVGVEVNVGVSVLVGGRVGDDVKVMERVGEGVEVARAVEDVVTETFFSSTCISEQATADNITDVMINNTMRKFIRIILFTLAERQMSSKENFLSKTSSGLEIFEEYRKKLFALGRSVFS
jgi:hypothetical protein